ncbi:MAG: Ig-like domain-containing protein [Gemmatimonadota bacterium]
MPSLTNRWEKKTRFGSVLLAVLLAAFVLGSCEEVIAPVPNLVSLTITPNFVDLQVGQTQQFTVQGNYANGSAGPINVTFTATGGTVSNTGLYTASAPGSFQVIATGPGGLFASATVAVNGVQLTPDTARVQGGASVQFHAMGVFTNNSQPIPLTFTATGGTVSQAGLYVAPLSPGTFRVIAAAATGQADTSVVIVTSNQTSATLQSISLNPQTVTVQSGGTQPFVVNGSFSDGSSRTVTTEATLTAAGGSITTQGIYTAGNVPGVYQVTADFQGRRATATVNIVPVLLGLSIQPATALLEFGGGQQFQVSAQFSNGTADVTGQVTYVATGGNITQFGFYTAGNAAGNYQVRATLAGMTTTAAVTIVSPGIASITMTPPQIALVSGATQQFSVIGTRLNLTQVAVAPLFSATGGTVTQSGLYTAGNTPGNFQVIALEVASGKADTSAITILPPTLQSISVTPNPHTMFVSTTQQLTVTGAYSNGTTQNHTNAATYQQTCGTTSATGLYTAPGAAGNCTVTASFGGLNAQAAITVSSVPVALTGITITPTPVSVQVGTTRQFTVMGNYSNGTTQNHTNAATYQQTCGTTSATGLFTASGAAGNCTVTASFGGFNAQAVVTVTPASVTLAGITIAPASVSLLVNATQQFTVTGSYSNGSTQNHTNVATYQQTCGATSATGLYTAPAAAGNCTVTASFGGFTAPAAVTVTAAPAATLQSITLTPVSFTLQVNATRQMTVTGNYSNGTTQNHTNAATYQQTCGTMSATGLFTAPNAPGNCTVTASFGGFQSPATGTITQPGVNPAPGVGDVVRIDTRQTLQQATNLREMWSAITCRAPNSGDPLNPGLQTDAWSLAFDIDGNGTNAVRRVWYDTGIGDRDGKGSIESELSCGTQGIYPKEVWIQWKQLLGRTPTGGGIGQIGYFNIHNPNSYNPNGAPGSDNAGRKNMLVFREEPGHPYSGNDRFDYLWYGSGGMAVGLGNNVSASVWSPQQHVGQILVHTIHLKAASSANATDSIEELYINGQLFNPRTGGLNEWPFRRNQLPSTFRSPACLVNGVWSSGSTTAPVPCMTEYYWDFLIWTR